MKPNQQRGIARGWVVLLAARPSPAVLGFQQALQQLPLQSLAVVADGLDTLAYLHGDDQYGNRSVYPFPSVVFIDSRMPALSGLGLLCWLRNQPRFCLLPVAVLAKDFSGEQVEMIFRLGAACCRHSATPDEIMEAIRRGVRLAVGSDSELESRRFVECLD